MGDIAKNWKELSGKDNWEGLLDPLDINLRRYIIHYGERAQAVYDAFNNDNTSQTYKFPLYAPEDLFSNVGLEKDNPYKYTVTNYLYAISDIDSNIDWAVKDQSAWIGYVAVATDEGKAVLGRRDILISWRGTQLAAEWLKDINFSQTSASDIFGDTNNSEVHNGFHSLYTSSNSESRYNKFSIREQVLSAVRNLVDKYKDEEISITVTGHSLGSALATLNIVDIVANGYNKPTGSNKPCTVTAFVFASPKVGDKGFKALFDKLSNLHLLRIENEKDVVPKLPPGDFVEVGEELKIDTTDSPYVDTSFIDVAAWHGLENYLHGVAGSQENGKFDLVVERDIALVNKGLNLLKKEYSVPPNWWDPLMNKRMVQQADGHWKLDNYMPEPPSIGNGGTVTQILAQSAL